MTEPRRAWDRLDQITVDFYDVADGRQLCRQLKRHVVERAGSWALVAFLYERASGPQRAKWVRRVALHRYRKQGGGWRKHSSISMTPTALREAVGVLLDDSPAGA